MYITVAGGGSGNELLYATGVTSSTLTFSTAAPTSSYARKPPTVNSTGFSYVDGNGAIQNAIYQYVRAAKDGNLEDVYRGLARLIDDFNRGNPLVFSAAIAKLRHYATTFSMLATLCTEVGTLIDANPGTLKPSLSGSPGTMPSVKRTWP